MKTGDYGNYTLSNQRKDAMLSVETVEKITEPGAKQNKKAHGADKNVALKSAVAVLALLLVMSLALVAWEYNEALFFQSEISQRDSVIIDRDTLITQLDTASNLAQSRLNLKLPNGSQYLTTLPDADHTENLTKIFLISTAAGYSYLPPYPFKTPWFSGSGSFSSQRVFELTDNRFIALSFWGWTFDAGGLIAGKYEYGIGTGDPVLIIAVTIRNDYTSADAGNGTDTGAPIGNRISSYLSLINLTARLYSWNASIIQAADAKGTPTPTAASRTARGGCQFTLGSGQTKQVIFYLSPSSLDIDHYEIYVSYLSAY
jgi:hypothetical protein